MLTAPFPYPGGKRRIAATVWQLFGDVRAYVEPFAGSLAVLLARPEPIRGTETINDLDCFVANFWRAVTLYSDAVAEVADYPVSEVDLTARHRVLVGAAASLRAALEADPAACDPMLAGWWAWGLSQWIGDGWCKGGAAPQVPCIAAGHTGGGVVSAFTGRAFGGHGDVNAIVAEVGRQMPQLGSGNGVTSRFDTTSWGNAGMQGALGREALAREAQAGPGESHNRACLRLWMGKLSARLRNVRITCGDWTRLLKPAVTKCARDENYVAIFLDPPYSGGAVEYSVANATDPAVAAWEWACANGDDPMKRIVVCGEDDGRPLPPGWHTVAWKRDGMLAGQRGGDQSKRARERLYISPACLPVARGLLDYMQPAPTPGTEDGGDDV